MSTIEQLRKLYFLQSKHANYQTLAPSVLNLIGEELRSGQPRYEAERFAYVAQKIDLAGKTLLEIGANTGYFSLRALEGGTSSVTAYEGNQEHAAFLSLAAQALELSPTRFRVVKEYFVPDSIASCSRHDVLFLMNVVHHLGDDYGDTRLSKEQFFEDTRIFLQQLAHLCAIMVFQIGYCWKGNRETLLFQDGTKHNQLDFIRSLEGWSVEHVGIAECEEEDIFFADMSEKNMLRDDSLKEFLNRPIFILRSTTKS